VETPRRKSERMKKSMIRSSGATSSQHDRPLLAADFDQFKWKIMYPLFVESGLADPPERTDK
jgi:hypothetical protein